MGNGVNCSDPNKTKYTLAMKNSNFHTEMVIAIRSNPNVGKFIEGHITEPPCKNENVIQKFKIKPICDFH